MPIDPDCKEPAPIKRSDAVRMLLLLIAIAGLLVLTVAGAYALQFGPTVSKETQTWALFGDYFGGTLNPLLAFLSFVALIMTLALQTRQLEMTREQLALSRAELEATRDELKRSADAQTATAKALKAQARFAATSARISATAAALSATDDELKRLREHPMAPAGEIGREIAALTKKRESLLKFLEGATSELLYA